MNGGKGRGGPVPLSTSINLHPGQGFFHPLSLPVFYWALPKRLGDDGPHKSKWNLERSNVGCVGQWGTGSVRVRTRKQDGWVDEWRREKRKKFQLEQCELELSNKSGKISQAEATCPFLINQRGANEKGTQYWLSMDIKLWYFFGFYWHLLYLISYYSAYISRLYLNKTFILQILSKGFSSLLSCKHRQKLNLNTSRMRVQPFIFPFPSSFSLYFSPWCVSLTWLIIDKTCLVIWHSISQDKWQLWPW